MMNEFEKAYYQIITESEQKIAFKATKTMVKILDNKKEIGYIKFKVDNNIAYVSQTSLDKKYRGNKITLDAFEFLKKELKLDDVVATGKVMKQWSNE